MSNALLSDVEARAERRRTRTRDDMWQELVQRSWDRAMAAADPAEKRKWLERAHRLQPKDGTVAIALGGVLLDLEQWTLAALAFETAAREHGIAEAWTGLAACRHLLHDGPAARAALAEALRLRAPDAMLIGLANAVAPQGWCGVTTEGVLHAGPGRPSRVLIDGATQELRWSAGKAPLPPGWRQAAELMAEFPEGPALGSPLPLGRFSALEGFVQAGNAGLSGWAWFPADPSRDPVITVQGTAGQRLVRATRPAEPGAVIRPLARPRRFELSAAEVTALGAPLALRGPDGRHLLGSPIDPRMQAGTAASPVAATAASPVVGTAASSVVGTAASSVAATASNPSRFSPVWADTIGGPARPSPTRPPVDIVVPVYRGRAETLACLASVRAGSPRGTRVLVVNDASPDPQLVSALQALAQRRHITLITLPDNLGFPGAANAGMRAAAGRDVVLLNSDTLVPPGWLARLRAAAYAAPDIGTATPLTNDGTIVSYPDVSGGNPSPDPEGVAALDDLARQANAGQTVDIPVGVGFCLYLRRDCLDQVGLLREDLFAQGYGEENDLCLRARHHGWRNVAALDVYVAHVGATSFGDARTHLVRRNSAILERLHPGYGALVEAHASADPLLPARGRIDRLRWAEARRPGGTSVVIVTHAGGGGVDRVIEQRTMRLQAKGQRVIVLRPWRGPGGAGVQVKEPGTAPTPNLVFPMPGGLPDLARLLRADRPARVELHHLLGHHAGVAGLAARLKVPLVSVVHDYARFCPRIALVSTERRYCGEPDLAGCEACVADLGSLLEDDPPVPLLLERSAAELGAASTVVAPSADAASRMRRHFPGIATVVEPWGDDSALPPLSPAPAAGRLRVAVIGAIGTEKGYEVLIGCVRDARARALPLEFVVVGFTADDERLLAAGPVHVTGEYAEADGPALIRAQAAQLAFIPSVWPETWCFALSRAWEAGLAAAVFDLGAQAERVRNTGRGWLLPLGLAPARINDALLRMAA